MSIIAKIFEVPLGLDGVDYIVIKDGAGHYLELPSLSTTQRDALVASNGMLIYNSTTSTLNSYEGGSWGAVGSGDVVGPGSATDNAVARFDLTTGKIIQNSVVIIADTTGDMTGVGALTLGDVLTFSDGGTIDNTDATTLTITETNIDLVGATSADALTLSDILTFSDGATIDNSDASTLQLTETNIDLVGATAADALTLSDVLTFSDGGTIDNTNATTLTITETNIDLVGALAADAVTLSDVLTFSDGATIDNSDANTLTLTETTVAISGAFTVSGASTFSSAVTVGQDDTGYDTKFFGATSGAFCLWDESEDSLLIRGPAATPGMLVLQTAETTVVDGDKLGQIDFQAPLEADGTDAIVVAASIWAEADDTFAADNNSAELVFATASSGAVSEVMRVSRDGRVGIRQNAPAYALDVIGDGGTYALYVASGHTFLTDRLLIAGTNQDPDFYLYENSNQGGFMRWDRTGNYMALDTRNDGDWYYDTACFTKYGVGIGTSAPHGTGGAGPILTIAAGTHPTAVTADCATLFVEDVGGDGNAELRVIDENENETTLSPHNFTLFQPDPSYELPWSYYSSNPHIGKEINVDMFGAIRAIEQLSGKQFIYIADLLQEGQLSYEEWLATKLASWKSWWIKKNMTEVEVSPEEAVEEREVEEEDRSGGPIYHVMKKVDGYELVNGKAVQKSRRVPVYPKRTVTKLVLKDGLRFDEMTGKITRRVVPTEAEADVAAATEFKKDLPAWIKERIQQ